MMRSLSNTIQFVFSGPVYLFIKVVALLFVFVWVRASVSRPRFDQLMQFNWKFMIPLGLVVVVVASVLTVYLK